MPRVLALALPLVLWGFWAFLPKVALRRLGSETTAFAFQSIGSVVGAVFVFLLTRDAARNKEGAVDLFGLALAISAGVIGAAGLYFYLRAISRESIAVVSSITALYPIVAALLARVFLNETLSIRQLAGMALAVIAIALVGDGH